MRPHLLLLTILLTLPTAAQTPAQPTRHEYHLHNFHTESGVTLPDAVLVYGTQGTLNPAHYEAILLPSHYTARHHLPHHLRALRQRPQLSPSNTPAIPT